MNMDIKEQLEIINQYIKELAGSYRNVLSGLGISENEFWIWYSLLIMGEEYFQQDICGMWSLTKQTVNTIIMNLVKKDLLVLESDSDNRNRKRIRVTDKGRIYGENIVMPILEAEQKSLAKMNQNDRIKFLSLLKIYISDLKDELSKI